MTNEKKRIDTLAALIKKYQKTYYSGEAEISDSEFDLLWDELKNLAPNHPLLNEIGSEELNENGQSNTDGFPKAKHLIPMGSQEKAANPEEFRAWAKKTNPGTFVVQFKLDGASLELQYEKGKLKAAVTRGDGNIGDEITKNAQRMSGVLPEISKKFSGGVRGEVVMRSEIWKTKYSTKANCRNAANGLMRRKDGSGCEDLNFISYDAGASGNIGFFNTEMEKITWLKEQGFSVVQTREFTDPEDIISYRDEIAKKRKNLDIDIDGLVVKDSVTDALDLRRAKPEKQIAFKFDPEMAVSVLREVIWSESGATYTPIGIIDPVRLAGTTVQRANLNNPDMIRTMGLKIGSPVTVVKRGEIIPKIEGLAAAGTVIEGEKSEIVFPTHCGSCNTVLVDAGTRLYCPNIGCPKKLHHRLEKWVSVLDIRELGEKLLKVLFDSGRVRNISDLYTLTEEELTKYERMGELSAAKVIRHIRSNRKLPLAAFVAGFDFEGVGELIVEKAVSSGFDTLEKLRSATLEELSDVHGLGEISALTIKKGLEEAAAEMDAVLASGFVSIIAPRPASEMPLKGFSFCFTGELKNLKRNHAEERVKALGGTVKSSVVKDLFYLVTNDSESKSAKNKKARELGITIINEDAFLALLHEKTQNSSEKKAVQTELF